MADARGDLCAKVGASRYALLTPAAHAGWERYLLLRFTQTGAKAAHWKFQVYKAVSQVFPKYQQEQQDRQDTLYRAFVGDDLRLRLGSLFDDFPRLRLLCDALVTNWIAAVSEFLARLEMDLPALGVRLGVEGICGRVIAIDAGLSDPHRGGRCVARVHFEEGGQLIYKPRTVAPEELFSELLVQINGCGIPHPLKAARCWDHGGYGWMEDVPATPCTSFTDIRAFYWRAGALLGLVHLARGVDFHRENLIANGAFPILVDLETLWHPQEHVGMNPHPTANSILRTGFLPQSDKNGAALYDWSALSRNANEQYSGSGWMHVNEDDMRWVTQIRRFKHHDHLPTLDHQIHPAGEYVTDITEGFRWIGKHLLADGLGPEQFTGWLHKLTRCPRRRLLRSSAWYQMIRERFSAPQFLSSGAHQALGNDSENLSELLTSEEVQSLEQLDIPYLMQDALTENPRPQFVPNRLQAETFLKEIATIVDALTIIS